MESIKAGGWIQCLSIPALPGFFDDPNQFDDLTHVRYEFGVDKAAEDMVEDDGGVGAPWASTR